VPRRARQNKSPKTRINGLIQKKVWNILSQGPPNVDAIKPQDNIVHKFVQQVDGGTVLTSSTVAAVGAGIVFTLSGVPNSAAFATLFDQYRIVEIEVWLQPQSTPANAGSGFLYSAVDYDNSPTLTVAQISQYSNVLIAPIITVGHYHRFKPHVAQAAYGGGVFTSFANVVSPWLDVSSNTIAHYGLSVVSAITSSVNLIDVQVRYHLEFRNVT